MPLFGINDHIISSTQRLNKLAGLVLVEDLVHSRDQRENTGITFFSQDGNMSLGIDQLENTDCRGQQHSIADPPGADEEEGSNRGSYISMHRRRECRCKYESNYSIKLFKQRDIHHLHLLTVLQALHQVLSNRHQTGFNFAP